MRLYHRTTEDCAYWIGRSGFAGPTWFSENPAAWASCGGERIEIEVADSLLDAAWRDGVSIAGEQNWVIPGEIATAHIVRRS